MKIPKKYKYEYVSCLPKHLEYIILSEVSKTIPSLYLADRERIEAVKNASRSKVCDLTETINIKFV